MRAIRWALSSIPGDQGHANYVELRPATALEPNTHYTLQSFWIDATTRQATPASIAFTTGAGPLTEVPAKPTASLQQYTFQSTGSTCDPNPAGYCVELPASRGFIEAAYIDEFGQAGMQPTFYRGPFFDTGLVPANTDFVCLQLRARAENGTYSDALILCRSNGPVFALSGSPDLACTAAGIPQDGKLVENVTAVGHEGGGCAVSRGGSRAGVGMAWSALAVGIVLSVARGARRRDAS